MDNILLWMLLIISTILDIYIFRVLYKKNELFSPYTFFSFVISVELLGPLYYYIVLNENAYRDFNEETLTIFCMITIFVFFIIALVPQINYIFSIKIPIVSCGKKIIFYIYTLVVTLVIMGLLYNYRNELLLVAILGDNNINLLRNDETGIIPHWITISSFISCIIPSFAFFYIKYIKSYCLKFILITFIGILTMIDGNKAGFIYIIIFSIIYVYKLKPNIYMLISTLLAFTGYFMIKGITELDQVDSVAIDSPFRRFFVSQGAGFINRIQMVSDGYSFSSSRRIAEDVFYYIYGYEGGAPTVFWGDIFVEYGYVAMIFSILISVWIFYGISKKIYIYYYDNYFIYWCYSICIECLCFAEIGVSNLLRITLVFITWYIYASCIEHDDRNKTYMKLNS